MYELKAYKMAQSMAFNVYHAAIGKNRVIEEAAYKLFAEAAVRAAHVDQRRMDS